MRADTACAELGLAVGRVVPTEVGSVILLDFGCDSTPSEEEGCVRIEKKFGSIIPTSTTFARGVSEYAKRQIRQFNEAKTGLVQALSLKD